MTHVAVVIVAFKVKHILVVVIARIARALVVVQGDEARGLALGSRRRSAVVLGRSLGRLSFFGSRDRALVQKLKNPLGLDFHRGLNRGPVLFQSFGIRIEIIVNRLIFGFKQCFDSAKRFLEGKKIII